MDLDLLELRRVRRAFFQRAYLLLFTIVMATARAQTPVPTPAPTPVSTPPPTVTVGTSTADFSLSIAPPPVMLQRGGQVTLTTIVASVGGFNQPVTLSVQGDLPQWLTVTFSPAVVTPVMPKPTWAAITSSALYIDTSTVPYFYTKRGRAASPGRSRAALAMVPGVFGLLLLGFRRRRGLASLLCMAVLGLLPLASGCGAGRYPDQVAPGVYTITVLATAPTGQQHVLPLLLRVSQ